MKNCDGVDETIELLSECSDENLVFKYANWIFELDDQKSISVCEYYIF